MSVIKKIDNQLFLKIEPEDIDNQALEDVLDSISVFGGITSENIQNKLINELNSATILLPPVEIGGDMFEHDDDGFYALIFSNIEMFYDYYYDEDIKPVVLKFKEYYDFVLSDDKLKHKIKGININSGINSIKVPFDKLEDEIELSKIRNLHSVSEIKRLRSKINRDKKLSRYLSKSKKPSFDKFIKLASKSYLFTYYVGIDNFNEYAEDGIIALNDLDGSIFVVDESGVKCCMIFTLEKLMEPTLSFYKKRGRNIYSQITDLKTIAEFVINVNLDVIIVNYAHDDMIIPKEYLKDYLRKIKKLNDNKSDYSNYALVV